MRFSRRRQSGLGLAAILLGAAAILGCGPSRLLAVPTTPPSERNENPGLNQHLSVPAHFPQSGDICPSAEDCFNIALKRWGDGNPAAADLGLRRLRERFPDSPWAGRAGFLLGKWASEIGSPEADALLSSAEVQLPELKEYALFFKANGTAKSGRSEEAISLYDRIGRQFPDSVLIGPAAYLKADTRFRSGDCPKALADLEEFVGGFPANPYVDQALLQGADCAVRMKDYKRAAGSLQRIYYYYAAGPRAAEAGQKLEALRTEGVVIPAPAPEARSERGRALVESARYPEAAAEWRALLAEKGPAERNGVRLELGETLVLMKRYDEAKTEYLSVVREDPAPEDLTSAVFWLGRIALRKGDEDGFLKAEQDLASRHPTGAERAKLLFWIGDYYESRQQIPRALEFYRRLITEIPMDPSAEEAVWRLGWLAYREGRWAEAIKILEGHVARRPNSPLAGQFGYWIGRSAERAGLPEKAASAFRGVCSRFPRSYYCRQADSRLARLKLPPTARDPDLRGRAASENGDRLPNGPSPALVGDRHYAIARELLRLDLKSEARRELGALSDRYASDRGNILELVGLFYSAGDYPRGLRLIRTHFQDFIEKGGDGLPNRFWEGAYPRYVVDLLPKKEDTAGSVDPYLVAAVIREESAFDPNAVSRAGAMGLMQLLPSTANWVAARMGLTSYRPEMITDHDTNLRLGAWYLAHLIERFNGNFVFAIAAYNAGPEAVGRWANESASNMDEFIESVPFSETRFYTKRVLRSYHEYLRIAGLPLSVGPTEVRASP